MFCGVLAVFIERVDYEGHHVGPEGDAIKPTIKAVDDELVKLLDLIGSPNNDINLMVWSDHGMAERIGGPGDAVSGMINICNYINCPTDWEHAYGSTQGPILSIWPWPNNTESVGRL